MLLILKIHEHTTIYHQQTMNSKQETFSSILRKVSIQQKDMLDELKKGHEELYGAEENALGI